ncbi:MAG: hypothetical protein QXG98_02380 [Candidatus Micrarchaeia archaeon]
MKFLRPQAPANQTLSPRPDDITARSQARNPFSFGRRLLTTGIILGVSTVFTLAAGNFARAGENGKQPTKIAQGKEAEAAVRALTAEDLNFKLGKTYLADVMRVLEERGVKNITTYKHTNGFSLMADGLAVIYSFDKNTILDGALRLDPILKSDVFPRNYAIAWVPSGDLMFITAENFEVSYDGRYVLGVVIVKAKDLIKPQVLVFPLRELIERNGDGGFKEPKFIYVLKERVVVLTAKNSNGETWKEFLLFDAETGEALGFVPASALKTALAE